MSEQFNEIEDGLNFCEKCGRTYTDDLEDCPYCQAERRVKYITKHGSYKSRGAILGSLILALVLIAGAVGLIYGSVANGGWSIGRQYAVEDSSASQVQSVGASTTQESMALDAVESETAVVTDSAEPTDSVDDTAEPTDSADGTAEPTDSASEE